jgi:hypothetical protein
MYKAEFTDNEDLVMTLEIEAENRCEMLHAILNDDYTQYGDFVIEGYETDNIIFDLLIGEMNPDSNIDIQDTEYQDYLYRAKLHSEYGITLGPFLSDDNYEVNTIDIFNFYCESIKLAFEWDNDSLNINYKTERV